MKNKIFYTSLILLIFFLLTKRSLALKDIDTSYINSDNKGRTSSIKTENKTPISNVEIYLYSIILSGVSFLVTRNITRNILLKKKTEKL